MIKKSLITLLLLLLVTLLAACGGGPAGGPSSGEEDGGENGKSQLASELSVYNWADYIDEQILKDYEAEYGVKIIYDTYASNEDLLAKVQAGATGYDIIFPSDYMISQMIALGLLAEIDLTQLSNFGNIGEQFKDRYFDPGNKHCVPYLWGTTGVAYRAGYSPFEESPPDSWAYLFDPALLEQYATDGVNVLNDPREIITAALLYLDYSPNTQERAELEAARDLILQAKPYWKTFNAEDYDDSLLVTDEVVLSHAWNGDAQSAYFNTFDEATQDGNWRYVVPKEGGTIYMEGVCILKTSERQETALHFMNYLLEPEVAAAITNATYYASANEAAKQFIDPVLLVDPSVYPPDEVIAKLVWIEDVGDAVFIYDEIWTTIKGQ